MMTNQWTVVFRKGGTENFKWSRTLGLSSRVAAVTVAESLQRAGYACYVEDLGVSLAVGVPETFEPDAEVDGGR